MSTIAEIKDFAELESHYEKLYEEIENLKSRLDREVHNLTAALKKERYLTLKSFRKKLERENSNHLQQEIEKKRAELYKKKEEYLEKLTSEQLPYRLKLEEMETEFQELSQAIAGVTELRKNRKNSEFLTLIINSLREIGKEDYSVRIFDKEFTYVGIGTHSDTPHYYENRTDGVVAIVKNDFDISKIPEKVISYPEENQDYYQDGSFILYKRFTAPVKEYPNFLTDTTYLSSELPGMNEELSSTINNSLFQAYKETLQNKQKKTNI